MTYRKLIIAFLFLLHSSACSSQDIKPSPLRDLLNAKEAKDPMFAVKLRTRETINKMIKNGDAKSSPITLAAADEKEKLSIPLLVAMSFDVILCGHTKSGEWIIQGSESSREKLAKSSLVESVRANIPESFIPVRDIVLIYDNHAKPSAKTLESIDLTVVEDNARKTYGYMMVRYSGKSNGIPSQLIKAIRNIEGVSNADVIATVAIEQPPIAKQKVTKSSDAAVK